MGRMQARFEEGHPIFFQSKHHQLKLRKSRSRSLNLRRRYLVKISAIVNIQTRFSLSSEKVLLESTKDPSIFNHFTTKLLFVKNQRR